MSLHRILLHLAALLIGACLLAAPGLAQPAAVGNVLSTYLTKVAPGDLVPGADAYGPIRDDLPVAPVLQGEQAEEGELRDTLAVGCADAEDAALLTRGVVDG